MQPLYMMETSYRSTANDFANENYPQFQDKLSCNMASSFYYNPSQLLQEQNFDYSDCKLTESKYYKPPEEFVKAYQGDLVYSVNLPSMNLPPSTMNSKKVPFQFKEDLQGFYHQQMQAEKQAALNKPMSEALQAFHDLDQEHDSEDEGIEDYKLGGYHPVHVGEVLFNRYVTIQKLGWGHFSTVWLCKDFKYDTYVAVKVQKSAEHYIEAAYDEVEILQKVAQKVNEPLWVKRLADYKEGKFTSAQDDSHVVQLLNSFVYKAPYGSHFCMVFEILGVNLLEIIKRYEFKGIPLNLCKKIAKQTLIGLDFLHSQCGVIHTDLKPENVLLQLSKEEIKDIIENGQLTKNQIFQDRIKLYHEMFGIPQKHQNETPKTVHTTTPAEVITEVPTPVVDTEKKLSKTQKKNQKKREKKKQAKAVQETTAVTNIPPVVIEKASEIRVTDSDLSTQQEESQQTSDGFKNIFSVNKEKINFKRPGKLSSDFQIKIADLGNACWTHHHFSTLIQTRQYRSPETILGATYNETADMWSLACMMFELLTGDFLFEPRKGAHFSKNDDHLAQMSELMGRFPLKFSQRCAKSKRYFNKDGSLRRIPMLNCWSIKNVLVEKYKFKRDEAEELASFFEPMLNPMPECRVKAGAHLKHPWLNIRNEDTYTGKMSDEEFKLWQQEKEKLILNGQYLPHHRPRFYESEEEQGDCSDRGTPIKRVDTYRRGRVIRKQKVQPRQVEMAIIDRSFTDLGYIGFENGIDTHKLDQTNWQFN